MSDVPFVGVVADPAVRAAGRNTMTNHVLRHGFADPDGVALRWCGTAITWARLVDDTLHCAGALAALGVGPGDRVALLLRNRPEFVVATLAAGYLGAITVPLGVRLAEAEVAGLLRDCAPRVVVVEDDLQQAVAGHADAELVVGGTEAGWDDALRTADPPAPADVEESAPALILYTSGTTGRPKGAVLSHANLQAQAMTSVRAWRMVEPHETQLIATPLSHIGGVGNLPAPFLVGGTVVLHPTRAFDAAEILDVMETERVTSTFLVPSQWQALCDEPGLADHDLTALRVMCWGAAPATTALLRRMGERFPSATSLAVFGQTEMSPVTCALDARDALRKVGSVGRPVPTLAMRVVDDDMADVAPGEVGEAIYRGPTQMLGYWNRPDATEEAFRGGWLHSGDLVRVDDEGFVYVVDRKKDMIITGGENVYSAEVEDVLADHPGIAEVAVVGRRDPKWGETPVAFVVLAAGTSDLDVVELRAWARDRLAGYKLPTEVVGVAELPRNANGKVRKSVLRELDEPPQDRGP